MIRRLSVAAAVGVAMLHPGVASAHGIGGRADLPLELSMVSYGAAMVLVLTFAGLAWLWPRSRWRSADIGRPLPAGLESALRAAAWPLRLAGLVVVGTVVTAAVAGPTDPRSNVAPFAVYVVFWVGFLFASAVIGDIWRAVRPAQLLVWIRHGAGTGYRLGHWPAAALLLAFAWLELVHPNSASPRVLATALLVYISITVAGTIAWGSRWLREGDPFGATFGIVAAMAPLGIGPDGRLRLRPPLVGLVGLPTPPGTVALVFVLLGSTTYDGLERTRVWQDVVGGGNLLIDTLGLVWTIAAVYVFYRAAVALMPVLARMPEEERDTEAMARVFVHSLVPIALAYVVAHYFSLLVFEGQAALALASDPLARGWDLFGTAGWRVDYTAVSPRVIAYVQTGAVVIGHLAGVVLAHDRAMGHFPAKVATRTQYPLLAAMVAYTVGALVILLGG